MIQMTSNTNITFVPEDGTLGIDNQFLLGISPEYFSWVPNDVHAFHWYGEEFGGDIEFKMSNPFGSKKPNERIFELGDWSQLITLYSEEKQRRHDAEIAIQEAIESSRDYWEELRQIRNNKLLDSDWTQILDAPLTEEEVELWKIYRQELRDLPENIIDPKPLVNSYYSGDLHPDWPIPPN